MAADHNQDLEHLRRRLMPVSAAARDLAWFNERPWHPATHSWIEHGVPVLDLHDLDARLAREVVRLSAEAPPSGGAMVFVTGRGRHSMGPAVLGKVVRGELVALSKERAGWRWQLGRAGRLVLLTDPSAAPAAVKGELGWGIRIGVILALALLVLAEPVVGLTLSAAFLVGWLLIRIAAR